jgi:Ca2+-binding RTX toxin-like protein
MATVQGTNDADVIYNPWSFGGNDTFYGYNGDDRIYGAAGNDAFFGGAGADYLDGGLGIDAARYSDSAEGVVVNLDTGENFGGTAEGDTLVGIEEVLGSFHADILVGDNAVNTFFDLRFHDDDYLRGLDGNDQLFGLDGGDALHGDSGNDMLKGGGGQDWLDGGADDDWLDGGADGDHLVGGFGNDTIYAGSGNDGLYGQAGNDTLHGGADDDYMEGGSDNDTLNGGGGADWLVGGSGVDTADYGDSMAGVGVSLFNDTADGGDAAGDELDGIENLTGSAHADSLWGDDGMNVLRGMAGNDTLKGFGGADTLRGDAGDDSLDGGSGIDSLIGGIGNDIYFVDNVGDVVTESGGQGNDTVRTSVSWAMTAGADVETLRTTNDHGMTAINLTGNSSGNDVYGNDGNNVLNGRNGNDQLTGFGGADTFLFSTPLNAASNVDVINDFNIVDDTIVLDQAIFGGIGLGSVAGSQFVIGTDAQDAGDRIIYNDATGAVYYDSDGTGATVAIQFAQLSPGLALTNHDFFVQLFIS